MIESSNQQYHDTEMKIVTDFSYHMSNTVLGLDSFSFFKCLKDVQKAALELHQLCLQSVL